MSTGISLLCGKKVAATGKLQHYTRNALMTMLKDLGAFPRCMVSRQTDILIVGAKPGSKLQKAYEFDICIMTEEEFEAMRPE